MDSEAGLRAMMDLDQAALTARFDAQDHLLRALAITQSEHTRRLTRLEDGQQRVGQANFEQLEKIVLKVGTGASGGPEGNADQASSSHPLRRRA